MQTVNLIPDRVTIINQGSTVLDDINGGPPNDETEQPPSPPGKPRVWTVFVAIVLALVAAIVWQIVIVLVVVLPGMSLGADLQVRLMERLSTTPMFILMSVGGQMAFGLGAVFGARLSPEPLRERLGLLPVKTSRSIYPLSMLATLIPTAVGFGLAEALALILPPDPSFQMMFDNLTLTASAPFVLYIALAPGICEELMFRGYIQRRLLQRWTPVRAIGIATVIFALMHITPHAIVATFPIGLWLGVVAWRSGSIGPGILCHAFINGSVNAWRVLVKFGEISEMAQYIFLAVSLCVGLICFILALKSFQNAEAESPGHA